MAADTVIFVGRDDDRDEDLYLIRDSGAASAADYDFVATARNVFEDLLDEIERPRGLGP